MKDLKKDLMTAFTDFQRQTKDPPGNTEEIDNRLEFINRITSAMLVYDYLQGSISEEAWKEFLTYKEAAREKVAL